MSEWKPLSEVRHLLDETPAPPLAPSAGTAVATITQTVLCPTCGTRVAAAELARIGSTQVCPNCKEDYVQRLREGAPLGTQQWRYGGFWIRFAAYFIDYVILQLVNVVLLVGMFAVMAASGGGDESASGPNFVIVLFYLLMFATAFFYYVVPTGHPKMQGTLGKRIVGLRVIRENGENVGYGLAFGRMLAYGFLTGITLGIGLIMAAFDKEKRALHDHVCRTRVIYRDSAA
jgi:uncharacterized RDD family membrane protein YckC